MTHGHNAARSNSIRYSCATPDPAQSLFFGNGHMGGTVHTPDNSLYLLFGRSDIWSETASMGSIAGVRIRDGGELFTGNCHVRQECDLLGAEIRIVSETPAGRVSFRIVCLRQRDVCIIDIEDRRNSPGSFEVRIDNWHPSDQTETVGRYGPETWHTNGTSSFADLNRRVGVDAGALGMEDPLLGRAWGLAVSCGTETAPGVSRVIVATACAAPREGGLDAVRSACHGLLEQTMADSGAALEEHALHWGRFWEKSWVSLESASGDAEYEERLWYVNLYAIACACGGKFPPRFNGGLFLLDRDARDWDHGYWFQNMREIYWALLGTGHWEWVKDYFAMLVKALPFVRAQTASLFKTPGVSYRETQSFWGYVPHTDVETGEFDPGLHNNFSNNLEVCLLMHWYGRASNDKAFVEEIFYPLLKEIIAFFMTWAHEGDDGLFHVAPANALEVWPNCKDPMPDIAGLNVMLPVLIGLGESLGAEARELDPWRNFLSRLAPLPVGYWTIESTFREGIHADQFFVHAKADPAGIFLPAAEALTPRQQRCNMENAELYVVFPWGLVGLHSPPEEQRRFQNTWNHRTWKPMNSGWAQDVMQLARMGRGDEAAARSIEHARHSQRFPNGLFVNHGPCHFHNTLTAHAYLDSGGVHVAGINEMLLQSHDGVIRVVPAASRQWSGRFRLHTLDGVEVEAEFRFGKAVRADLRPLPGREGAAVHLHNGSPDPMEIHTREGVTQVPANGDYQGLLAETIEARWLVTEPRPPASEDARPDVIYPGYKLGPPAPPFFSGHWHDEQHHHGQIGLGRDGTFPATRTGGAPATASNNRPPHE